MRFLYSLLITLSMPLVLFYLLFRGLRDRRYLERLGERFGKIPFNPTPGGILVHAASVGEFNAAGPLVKTLMEQHPDLRITVSCVTPTGSERIRAELGERVDHCYFPFDLPWLAPIFLGHLQPALIVVLETEIWPNFYLAADKLGIPLLMVNARLSKRSLKRMTYARGLVSRVLGSVSWVGAQTRVDADRLREIGANSSAIAITGNLKFDLSLSPGLLDTADTRRKDWGQDRPVLVAGSTHEADENVILPAFAEILKTFPEALLVLVPRYPERFESAYGLARASRLVSVLRSQAGGGLDGIQCLVIDAMGELLTYYACADVTYVGGSVGDQGGHNPLEPAALGKPVLFGPNMVNARETADQLLHCGAAREIHDSEGFRHITTTLFEDRQWRERMGQAGRRLMNDNRGALAASVSAINSRLEKP
jgi:3-deoxy-D-manno-octulosonic-acid transferase